MKTLLTGASGFVGSHLAEELVRRGHDVTCIVRKTSDLSWLKGLRIGFCYADMNDQDEMKSAVRDAEWIFHLSGLTKAKKESEYYRVNADSSRILFEACREANPGVKKIVHVSSLAAAGPSELNKPRTESDPPSPLTFYGKSKWEGEKYAKEYSQYLPVAIIRPPAVYGPREKDIFFYFKLISHHLKPRIGLKEKFLSIIYVKDLVSAIILAAEKPQSAGQTYFIDDGNVYSWSDISSIIKSVMNTWTIPLFIPQWKVTVWAYLAESFASFSKKPALLNRQKIIELKQKAWTCSSQKIRNELRFSSEYDFSRGCRETYEWYRSAGWL